MTSPDQPKDPNIQIAELIAVASTNHLDRLKQLSDRGWRTDVLYWAVLLISGSTLLSLAAKPGPFSRVIVDMDWCIISGYFLSAFIYLIPMAASKYRSLVTERNRYQLLQDKVMGLIGIDDAQMIDNSSRNFEDKKTYDIWARAKDIKVTFRSIRRRRVFASSDWGTKVVATWAMISAIWLLSQVVGTYAYRAPAFDDTGAQKVVNTTSKIYNNTVRLDCAFLACVTNSNVVNYDGFKFGFSIWIAGTIFFFGLGLMALLRGGS